MEYRPWVKENEKINRARWEANGEIGRAEAIAQIIKAGLRMTASNLVDQLTQHSLAESDFYEALFRLDEVRAETRKKNRTPPK